MGVLLATGLVVGDSLFGLAYSGAVGWLGDPERLSVVGTGYAAGPWIGFAALAGLVGFTYARTWRRV